MTLKKWNSLAGSVSRERCALPDHRVNADSFAYIFNDNERISASLFKRGLTVTGRDLIFLLRCKKRDGGFDFLY